VVVALVVVVVVVVGAGTTLHAVSLVVVVTLGVVVVVVVMATFSQVLELSRGKTAAKEAPVRAKATRLYFILTNCTLDDTEYLLLERGCLRLEP
jgi:small-conductance mechanosensitive channel